LDRPVAGHLELHQAQMHGDVGRAPLGVLAAEGQRRVMGRLQVGRERDRAGAIGGLQGLLAADSNALDESEDGSFAELELVSDLGDRLSGAPPCQDAVAERKRNRGWHVLPS